MRIDWKAFAAQIIRIGRKAYCPGGADPRHKLYQLHPSPAARGKNRLRTKNWPDCS